MSDAEVDYASSDFSRGYEDGYLGRPAVKDAGSSYREGHITGEAEQDAPKEFMRADLYDQRLR